MKLRFFAFIGVFFLFISLSLKTSAQIQPNDLVSWGYLQGFVDQPVQSASVGVGHCIALKADGTVVGWGFNQWKQAYVPAGLNNVKEIDANENNSIALKTDGTVVAWGYDGYGANTIPVGLVNVK